jgi:hypothetical protein
MAIMPPGTLSFLYNVMNDTEMNQKFQNDPYEVMEFFQLSTAQQEFVQYAGTDLLKARLRKGAELELTENNAKPAQDTARQEANVQKLAEAYFNGSKRLINTVSPQDIAQILQTWTANDEAKFETLILKPIDEELKKGFGRFW